MAATKIRLYQDALRHLADARLDVITDDVESRFALDDAWAEAVDFVLRQAPWRFTLTTTALGITTGPVAGFTYAFSRPADWLRTHAIFVLSGARECPIDVRELGLKFSTNRAGTNYIRYVSSAYADPALASNPWPEHFAQLVAAYLAFLVAARVTGERAATGRMSQLFSSLLPAAVEIDAAPADPWLEYQLDGSFARVSEALSREHDWRHARNSPLMETALEPVPFGGFTRRVAIPSDWMRTHALYVFAANGERRPFDVREQAGSWYTNVESFYADYTVSTRIDATFWPPQFERAVRLALPLTRAPDKSIEADVALAKAALDDAYRTDADPPDPWLSYQLDGSFARVRDDLAGKFFWRFATISAETATTAAAGLPGGFDRKASQPVGWWRTRSLYVLTPDGQRRPFDIREQNSIWYTDKPSFWAEYLSAEKSRDATIWPMQFTQAVLLALRAVSGGEKPEADIALAQASLAAAVAVDADTADPWLPYQLDGSFRRAVEAVIASGFWTKHLKNLQLDLSTQLTDPAMPGLPYRFRLPADHLATHALYVPRDGDEAPFNIRESDEDWSTDTALFAVRYLSTDALDPVTWPEPVAKAVLAYLEWQGEPAGDAGDKAAPPRVAAYRALLGEALRLYSQPPSKWLRFQLDGSYQPAVKQVLEKARWRFAIKTLDLTASTDPTAISDGTVSTGYTNRFLKPNDWLRTIWVHYARTTGLYGDRFDIDFRDEEDAIHANWAPITLRYLTRGGLDATRWPANFSDAVLALLEHLEIRADPTKTAAAKAKLDFYERQCALAETLDDTGEVPRINSTGRFIAARYGRRGYGGAGGGFDGINGPLPSSTTILIGDEGNVLLADE